MQRHMSHVNTLPPPCQPAGPDWSACGHATATAVHYHLLKNRMNGSRRRHGAVYGAAHAHARGQRPLPVGRSVVSAWRLFQKSATSITTTATIGRPPQCLTKAPKPCGATPCVAGPPAAATAAAGTPARGVQLHAWPSVARHQPCRTTLPHKDRNQQVVVASSRPM